MWEKSFSSIRRLAPIFLSVFQSVYSHIGGNHISHFVLTPTVHPQCTGSILFGIANTIADKKSSIELLLEMSILFSTKTFALSIDFH